MTLRNLVRVGVAGLCLASSGVLGAQAPAGRGGAPDPAVMAAINSKPDTIGTGKYPSLKEMDPTLPDHVVYRPADLTQLGTMKMGVVAWGNGSCSANGASVRFHLSELASHGYLVIASGKILSGPGAPPRAPRPAAPPAPAGGNAQRAPLETQASLLTDAINWALAENSRAGSPYFGRIDSNQVAVSGWSCGGLQALQIAADPRVRAVVIHNSGTFSAEANRIPGMNMGKEDLKKLHTPLIYILGGPTDIAYANGMDDFSKIAHVPVMVANLKDAGHGGTFLQDNGGVAASAAVNWLDWQLRGDQQAGKRFAGKECGLCQDSRWIVDSKKVDANTK